MPISRTNFDDLSAADIIEFIDAGTPEQQHSLTNLRDIIY